MKILIICGSLEPGCDGVGDYSRRLAIELKRKGHPVAAIALNDPYLNEVFNGTQIYGGITLPVLRLPSNRQLNRHFQLASTWINEFDPDWLSLQFVPFAFQPKGLPYGMGRILKALGNGRKWHIMVHELWVGMDQEASIKAVCWGWLQKQLIKSIFTKVNPLLVNTQSILYTKMLENMGFNARHLPLFGNISVAGNTTGIQETFPDYSMEPKIISFVVFGGIHPGVPIEDLVKELKLYGINKGIKITLQMIGRCGPEQEHWEKQWKAGGFSVKIFGEQPEENISVVLRNASYGISTTPPSLIDKSGSVAAMLEHGLPILCISRPWHPRGFGESKLPPGVFEYSYGHIDKFISVKRGVLNTHKISDITDKFISNLSLM